MPTKKPLYAFLISLVCSPVIGMFNLGFAYIGFVYLFVSFFFLYSNLLLYLGIIFFPESVELLYYGFNTAIWFIGAIHCYLIAKSNRAVSCWYSHPIAITIFCILQYVILSLILYWIFIVPPMCMEHIEEIHRGDRVRFRIGYATRDEMLIGLPGETIELRNKILYINGIAVPRRPNGTQTYSGEYSNIPSKDLFIETLPEGKEISISERQTIEKYDNFPETKIPDGYYFILSTSRGDPTDSRLPAIGLIPRKDLLFKYSSSCSPRYKIRSAIK